MSKVFLSHSSEDKEWYVNIVYNKLAKILGEDNIVIDNVTFQEGRKTIEEIYYQLDTTDLFVIFLSDKALASSWVQDELTEPLPAKAGRFGLLLKQPKVVASSLISFST